MQIRITGGLGNQLFKFFNAVDLSRRLGSEFQLDLTWYLDSKDRRGLTSERNYDLDYFEAISVVNSIKWSSPASHRRFGQVIRHLPENIRKSAGVLDESSRDSFLRENRIPKFVEGSFEKLSNLPSESLIVDYLRPNKLESPWLSHMSRLVNSEKPTAIHVRMGDFLNLPEMYNVVKPTYYSNAIKIVQSENSSRPIHLFSDDPERAISFLPGGLSPSRIIHQSSGVKTGEIFTLMSRYPNLVCANSTFSWWAGYLGFLRGTMSQSTLPERFLANPLDDPLKYLIHAGSVVVAN